MGLPVSTLEPDQVSTFLKVRQPILHSWLDLDFSHWAQLMMSGMITYSFIITIVKLSLLLLYQRIFTTAPFKTRTVVVGAVCLAWFFVAIFSIIFQCRPFSAAFSLDLLLTDSCMNLQAYYWGTAIANSLLDIVFLVLPLHMVWNLKLRAQQKVLLFGVFLLGSL